MQNSLMPVAGLIVGALYVLLSAALIFRETRRAQQIDRRLASLRDHAVGHAPGLPDREDGRGGVLFRTLGMAAMRVASMLVPIGAAEREKLSRMLRAGGLGQQEALSVFLSAKLGGALLLGIATGLWAAGSETVGQHGFLVVLAALAGLVVGGVVPEYVLRAMVARRVRSMTSALPDALDMLVMCLESGLTAERGILTVAETLAPIEPNLAREFRQIEAELRVASDRRAALTEYYRRTEIDGLRDLVMALIQGDRYGTPLTQSMKNIAADERIQKAERIATQAERLPVLMTLPMLLLVMPGTTLLVAGPAVLSAISGLGKLVGG